MNVSVVNASLAATRSMIYGRRGAASNTHPPIRSHGYADAPDTPIPEYDRCPGYILNLYQVSIRGMRLFLFILLSMLSSDNTDKSIGSCDILSTDISRHRHSSDSQHPTVGTRSSVTLREPRHFQNKAVISEAVISRSCYFPKPLFPEAVNHHRKRYCR